MSRSFGLVDYKIVEAEYFLGLMMRAASDLDFAGVQFCASAFVSSTRSVTFAMQASLKGVPEFDAWYSQKQASMRANSLAKFFHDFRTVIQHIGDTVIRGGSYKNGEALYYFVETPDLQSVPTADVISACKDYFKLVLRLVYDCYIDLGYIVDGQQRFTASYFESLGKSIEDAEEEMGWPRGFSDIGDPAALPYRWQHVREHADGCQIERQFLSWLGLTLPRPEPLPPYVP